MLIPKKGFFFTPDVHDVPTIVHEEGWHSKLSPSSLHANMLCPGRFYATKNLPKQKDTIYSLEGTAAHSMLELLLLGKLKSIDPSLSDTYTDEKGTTIDSENMQHVIDTYRYSINLFSQFPDAIMYAELKVEPGFFWDGESICSGTADIVVLVPSTNTLYVLDYKNGKILVSINENYQLSTYALGAYLMFKNKYQIDTIITGILQPRAFHHAGPYRFDTWPVSDLWTKWKPAIANIVKISMVPGGNLHASEKACLWCGKYATCTEAARKGLADAANVFSVINPVTTLQEVKRNTLVEPQTLNDEQLKVILESEVYIKGWLKAVHEYAVQRFADNKPLNGFKMVNGRGSRRWKYKNEDELIQEFGKFINLRATHYYESKIKSPSKFEKSVKKLLLKDQWLKVNTEFIIKEEGKATLVLESDDRPALDDVSKVFDVIEPVKPPTLSFLD